MRGRVLLAWLFLGLVAVAPTARTMAEPAPTGPRIMVAPERFDFGPVLPGKAVTREFVIRNVGSSDLNLEKVQPSCGCTVATGYSPVVKPAGSTVLRITLTTPSSSGRIVKTVLVRSNDPARPVVELKIEATVTPASAGASTS
jgi:hypothetical protein